MSDIYDDNKKEKDRPDEPDQKDSALDKKPNPDEQVADDKDKQTKTSPGDESPLEADETSDVHKEHKEQDEPVDDKRDEIPESKIERMGDVAPLGSEKVNWWQKVNPVARRNRQIANIHAGYNEILGLVRSMRDNMETQVQTSNKLVEFMSQLPEVADSLKHMGAATEQQKEMLNLIKKQVDVNVDQNKDLSDSMKHFNTTLNTMDDTTRQVLEGAKTTENNLKTMLERSERRLIWLSCLLLLLVAGLGVGFGWLVYSGKIQFQNGQNTMESKVVSSSDDLDHVNYAAHDEEIPPVEIIQDVQEKDLQYQLVEDASTTPANIPTNEQVDAVSVSTNGTNATMVTEDSALVTSTNETQAVAQDEIPEGSVNLTNQVDAGVGDMSNLIEKTEAIITNAMQDKKETNTTPEELNRKWFKVSLFHPPKETNTVDTSTNSTPENPQTEE